MSYPINQPITYTAVASTQGAPSDTFNYAWSFDDGGTGNTPSVAHTWTTTGNHLATVTATDTVTLGTATSTKMVACGDLAAFSWTDTTKSITTLASGFGSMDVWKRFLYGSRLISFGTNSYQSDVNIFDTTSYILTAYPSVLPSGGFSGACLIPQGALAGKVLLYGNNSGVYGYWDISQNTYTQISASGGPGRINSIYSNPSIAIGKYIVTTWQDSFYCYGMVTFDCVNLTWSSHLATDFTINDQLFALPSGNVFATTDGSSATKIYTPSTNTTVAGPSVPTSPPGGLATHAVQTVGGAIWVFNTSSSGNASFYTESSGVWSNKVSSYPNTSQNASATGNFYSCYAPDASGNIFEFGGIVSGTLNYNKTKNLYYSVGSDTFTTFGALPAPQGTIHYDGTRFWFISLSNGRIYYSSPW